MNRAFIAVHRLSRLAPLLRWQPLLHKFSSRGACSTLTARSSQPSGMAVSTSRGCFHSIYMRENIFTAVWIMKAVVQGQRKLIFDINTNLNCLFLLGDADGGVKRSLRCCCNSRVTWRWVTDEDKMESLWARDTVWPIEEKNHKRHFSFVPPR